MSKAFQCKECNYRYSTRQSLHVHRKKCQDIHWKRLQKELRKLANHDLKPTHLISDPVIVECDVRVKEVWEELHRTQLARDGTLFRVVIMDAPQDRTCLPLKYDTLTDKQIIEIPIELVQEEGFLFMWVTNSKPESALSFFKKHGYRWIETIVWVKLTKRGTVFKGQGKYIQHGCELCMVGVKGRYENVKQFGKFKSSLNVIVEEMREASQKPEALYKIAEKLVPNGPFLEIFGRKHNTRRGWTTMGNQLR
ncbi:MT-A70 family protein [Oxytricha trifallax]|uniref:mRNA m(6)A methyltransferase n=1 Tax=Oxytricha trifallax TaxID=1172189 RepID=A0A073HZU6_9SPIT|nr:MT-A70 family protein [Oxytricha trifallax]